MRKLEELQKCADKDSVRREKVNGKGGWRRGTGV
jgi:hypothetical protein